MGIRYLLVALFVATVVLTPVRGAEAGPTAELSAGQAEARFVALINSTRSSRGLSTLSVDGELTGQSRGWSRTMAADGRLRHAGDLSVGISTSWELLGENVGTHDVVDIDRLYQAFVASPAHMANIVDPRFDRVGVGVAFDAQGRVWTTHRFMAVRGATPPPPTTTTRPPTTTTTRPPTTTTTARPTTTGRRPTTTAAPARAARPATTARPTTTARPATTARPTTTARPATTGRRPTTTAAPARAARPATNRQPTTAAPTTGAPTDLRASNPVTTANPAEATGAPATRIEQRSAGSPLLPRAGVVSPPTPSTTTPASVFDEPVVIGGAEPTLYLLAIGPGPAVGPAISAPGATGPDEQRPLSDERAAERIAPAPAAPVFYAFLLDEGPEAGQDADAEPADGNVRMLDAEEIRVLLDQLDQLVD